MIEELDSSPDFEDWNSELFQELDKEFPDSVLDCNELYSVKDAVLLILGGVSAISPDLYQLALQKIADLTGRELNQELRNEIRSELESFPCLLD